MARPQLTRVREQARLQLAVSHERKHSPAELDHVRPERPRGAALRALPEPSPWDLLFDIEADPWATEVGLEYLLGVVDAVGR